MYVRLNARAWIVEATDVVQESEYTEVPGSVQSNMPLGLLGFNGRVYTPNYMLPDGVVVARTTEDKALDPFSDEPEPDETEDMRAALELLGVVPVEGDS